MTEIDRLLALVAARPAVRLLRDGGTSWEDIATKFRKRCNPLNLSPRQMRRVYEENDSEFDKLKRLTKLL